MRFQIHLAQLFGLLVALKCLGCVEVNEAAVPPIQVDGTSSGGFGPCDCGATSMPGRAYRFTRLIADQPAYLADTLDNMWHHEISNYLLNVLLVVESAEKNENTISSFSKIRIKAGAGWRDPGAPYLTDDTFEVNSYCLMDESLNIEIEVTPYSGYLCRFRNANAASLFFHLGSLNDPLMCAPKLDPKNTTPIQDLHMSFSFNEDCTQIREGYLEGCLAQKNVNRICMCPNAGTCSKEGADPSTPFPAEPASPGAPFVDDALVEYCQDACSGGRIEGWVSFRENLEFFGIKPTCLTSDGEIGYRLSAFFEAEEITDPFSSALSAECSK